MSALDASLFVSSALNVSKLLGSEVAKAISAAPAAGQDVSAVMLDLRLPPEISSRLTPLLAQIEGCSLEAAEVKDRYGPSIRKYSVVRFGPSLRFVIHIPPWLLGRYSDEYRNALMSIPVLFPVAATVFIISENLALPHRILRNVISEYWKEVHRITGVVIPWQDIEELLANPRGAEDLRQILQLDGAASGTAPVPWVPDDIRLIVDVVAGCSAFRTPEYRRNLLELAGLGKICASVDFSGPAKQVAADVTLKLRNHGWVDEQGTLHGLGALLVQLAAEDDVSLEQKKQLREIVARYQLVPP